MGGLRENLPSVVLRPFVPEGLHDSDQPMRRRQALVLLPIEALRPEAVLAATTQQRGGEDVPGALVADCGGGEQRSGRAPEDLLGLVVDVRDEPVCELVRVFGIPELERDQQDPGLTDEQRRIAWLRRLERGQLDVVRLRAEEL